MVSNGNLWLLENGETKNSDSMFVNIQFFWALLISVIQAKCFGLVIEHTRSFDVVLSRARWWFLLEKTCVIFWKNWIANSIFFQFTVICAFQSRLMVFVPVLSPDQRRLHSGARLFFHRTSNFKVDVNTCIEFSSWLWKNSGAFCQVSNGLAQNPANFWPELFFSARDHLF